MPLSNPIVSGCLFRLATVRTNQKPVWGPYGRILLLTSSGVRPLKAVTIHRALLKADMLDTFRDPKILEYDLDITIIAHNGKEEERRAQVCFERS